MPNNDWQSAEARYNALFNGLKTAYDKFKAIDDKYSEDLGERQAFEIELAHAKSKLSVT